MVREVVFHFGDPPSKSSDFCIPKLCPFRSTSTQDLYDEGNILTVHRKNVKPVVNNSLGLMQHII